MFRDMLSRRSSTEMEKELMREMRALWIPSFRQALVQLQTEIRRARRYKRPLTIAVVTPERIGESAGLQAHVETLAGIHGHQGSLDCLLVGLLLRDEVRETDFVTYAASRDLYTIVMLETREDEAGLAMERLSEVAVRRLGYRFRTGTAEFPRDGLTIEDLFEHAARQWEMQPLEHTSEAPLLQEVRNA